MSLNAKSAYSGDLAEEKAHDIPEVELMAVSVHVNFYKEPATFYESMRSCLQKMYILKETYEKWTEN